MRLLPASAAAGFAALALGGCTAQPPSSAGKFQGPERDVAKVVDDLQTAGRKSDADRICTRVLSARLAQQMAAGRASCTDEVKKAIGDAGDFDLQVRDVTVSGATATAQVRQKSDGRVVTLQLARERDGWRLTSLDSRGA
jgi:hypothetical protein